MFLYQQNSKIVTTNEKAAFIFKLSEDRRGYISYVLKEYQTFSLSNNRLIKEL